MSAFLLVLLFLSMFGSCKNGDSCFFSLQYMYVSVNLNKRTAPCTIGLSYLGNSLIEHLRRVRFDLEPFLWVQKATVRERSPTGEIQCQLTQHGICFSTHGIIESPYAFDFLLSENTTAVFGEGGVEVNRVHGSYGQPFRNSDELRRHLCMWNKNCFIFYSDLYQHTIMEKQGKKKHAFFSQYGEVRKVDPPPVGPSDSVLYGWGKLRPR